MDRQFYVKNDAGEIDSVSEKEISTLAYFASLLDFAPELKEHFGMDVQLRTFFAQNPNHEFSDSYSALSSTLEGNLLLSFFVELEYLEKKFKEEGIKEYSMRSYNDIVEACSELFKVNNEEFSSQLNQSQPQ